MSSPSRAPLTTSHGSDAFPAPLGLTAVLPESLPRTLGTPSAPQSYNVDAVFTRRPLPDEVTALHSPRTREILSAAGYPSVTLHVSDRRLEIGNTSLDQLESGLSTVLGDHLARLTGEIRDAQEATRTHDEARAEAEGKRADAVAQHAQRIVFTRTAPST